MEIGLVAEASVTTRKRDYATFRRMLDENTRFMCKTIKRMRVKKKYGDIDACRPCLCIGLKLEGNMSKIVCDNVTTVDSAKKLSLIHI